jgi:hypothetical protein
MAHDAFAHHGLGSSALVLLAALHASPGQSADELVVTSAVSRATTYRTLRRLAGLGLVEPAGNLWNLAPRALEGVAGNSLNETVAELDPAAAFVASGWDAVAVWCGTAGVGEQRRLLHAAEHAAYRAALEQLGTHRSQAVTVVRDDRLVLVPSLRPDEIPTAWQGPGGTLVDPATGLVVPGSQVAIDGRLIHISPGDERSYDELAVALKEAVLAWESAA